MKKMKNIKKNIRYMALYLFEIVIFITAIIIVLMIYNKEKADSIVENGDEQIASYADDNNDEKEAVILKETDATISDIKANEAKTNEYNKLTINQSDTTKSDEEDTLKSNEENALKSNEKDITNSNEDDRANINQDTSSYYESEWIIDNPSGTIVLADGIDNDNIEKYFIVSDISDDILEYIMGKTYKDNPNISIDDLRYIKLIHYNFEHKTQIGEIIVNKKIAEEIKNIFMELYKEEYEIYSMYLPDRFWDGDPNSTDTASCDANNTSGFFYRTVEGSAKLSNHSYGMAIDINPRQNPYVSLRSGNPVCEHENALEFLDRDSGKAHMITTTDECYKLFTSKGYTWGGVWKSVKDYQHFEK